VPFAVVFVVLFLVVVGAIFFRLLPTVRGGANLPRESWTVEQPVPPTVAPPEIPPEAVPVPTEEQPLVPDVPLETYEQVPPVSGPAADTRERGLFFIQVENDGADLLLTRVSRTVRASDRPLYDSLAALLSGPTPEEAALGMVSFISPDIRILDVRIRGYTIGDTRWDTAYIDFNEYFQYNMRGSEGLISQIKQIVWTATEFPNVRDVQILIEGNREEFLHGGIRIGSPIGR